MEYIAGGLRGLTLQLYLWALCMGLTRAQWGDPAVQYQVREESDPRPIGNIVTDASLDLAYTDVLVLKSLQFEFMTSGGSSNDAASFFTLDSSSGLLSTARSIDRDAICPQQAECHLDLDVAVRPEQYFRIIKVRVEVLDVNDSPPRFSKRSYRLEISEATLPETSYALPIAVDLDSPHNGVSRYSLDRTYGRFELQESLSVGGTGKDVMLVLKSSLDYEKTTGYRFILTASDSAAPPHSDSMEIHVVVLDANDNTPVFENNSYEVTLLENTTVGSEIFRVRAHDKDQGENGLIEYTFAPRTQTTYGHVFRIHNKTGRIILSSSLNFGEASIYHLIVLATDHGREPKTGRASLIINVKDINDHKPSILVNTLTDSGQGEVSEFAPTGTFVAYVSVSDQDSGPGGEFDCYISSTNRTFRLVNQGEGEYKIVTRKRVNRERVSRYSIRLWCEDKGQPMLSQEKVVAVQVVDENDHSPVFSRRVYNFTLRENSPVRTAFASVQAADRDIGNNAKLQYFADFLDPTLAQFITVNRDTGELITKSRIDYEKIKLITFSLIAIDGGNKRANTTVNIKIKDENDNGPRFTSATFDMNVYENQPVGTRVGQVAAIDADSPPFNKLTFSLENDPFIKKHFEIHPLSGIITTKIGLDREEKPDYRFKVIASDIEKPSLKGTASVVVVVKDENDNAPLFVFPSLTNNTMYISSFTPVNVNLLKLNVIDRDQGQNSIMEYSLVNSSMPGTFEVDARYGFVRSVKPLDHIKSQVVSLFVAAEDMGFPIRKTQAQLLLHVNSSIPYVARLNQEQEGGFDHLLIIVGILIGTGLVIVILAVAILLTRRSTVRRQEKKYNCRSAAMKLVNGNTACVKENPVATADAVEADGDGSLQTSPNNTKTYLQVHQFLNIYPKDNECDSDVTGSGDLSITDSGRGPSEEGENLEHGTAEDRHKVDKPEITIISEEPEPWDDDPSGKRPHTPGQQTYTAQCDYVPANKRANPDAHVRHPPGTRVSWQQRRNHANSSHNMNHYEPYHKLFKRTPDLKRNSSASNRDSSPETPNGSVDGRNSRKKKVRISDTVTQLNGPTGSDTITQLNGPASHNAVAPMNGPSSCIFDFSSDCSSSGVSSTPNSEQGGVHIYANDNYPLSETEI